MVKMSEIENAIEAARNHLTSASLDPSDQIVALNNLALALRERFFLTGAIVDLDEAIRLVRQAIATYPHDRSDYGSLLSNLAVLLGLKYSKTSSKDDLEEAIAAAEDVMQDSPEDDPNKAGRSSNLAMLLYYRFNNGGGTDILERAIALMREALKLTSIEEEDHGMYSSNLAMLLGERFRITSSLSDVEEANKLMSGEAGIQPLDAKSLNNRAVQSYNEFQCSRSLVDLDNAIAATQASIDSLSAEHAEFPMLSSNLSIFFMDRFMLKQVDTDLNAALEAGRKAVGATPLHHPEYVRRIETLAAILNLQFSDTLDTAHLNEAIRLYELVFRSLPQDSPHRARCLHNRAVCLRERYLELGRLPDLEAALAVEREAVTLTPKSHLTYPMMLHSLGMLLGDRYSRNKEPNDLTEAITVAEEALEKTLGGNAVVLHHMGHLLSDRYSASRDVSDLERAIDLTRKALAEARRSDINPTAIVNSLACHVGLLFSASQNPNHINEAVALANEAVSSTAQGTPKRGLYSATLGARLVERYRITYQDADRVSALESYTDMLHGNVPVVARLGAALELIALFAEKSMWKKAYAAASTGIALLKNLAPRDIMIEDKQYLLSLITGLACEGAAVALSAGESPFQALRMLELGRVVLTTSLEDLQVETTDLEVAHPELAKRFIDLRNDISQSNLRYLSPSPDVISSDRHILAGRRRDTSEKFDAVISEIQGQPGFSDFLGAPSEEELRSIASHGAIAVVNVSRYRCDAILIDSSGVRSLLLPTLKPDDIKYRAAHTSPGNLATLEWLWECVAAKVLNSLGYSNPKPRTNLPRIWWIPTGNLYGFPLHAAGDYRTKDENVLDKAVSSYNSSVRAIVRHHRETLVETNVSVKKALLVAMEWTPGLVRLSSATEEIATAREYCKSHAVEAVEPQAQKHDVLHILPQCQLFHFAGHGHSHLTDPLQSCLYLSDWQHSKLTVSDLLATNIREKRPFLAYLSACATGQVKSERFIDESIHLISGFRVAGFRHIVGTLWSVNDQYCLDMSRAFYQLLGSTTALGDNTVASAVNLAVRQLRDRWYETIDWTKARDDSKRDHIGPVSSKETNNPTSEGVVFGSSRAFYRDIELIDEDDLPSLEWVQYIHFGA